MWLWILTGFNIIITLHGFSSGNVQMSCGDMVPDHGHYKPSTDESPFFMSYRQDTDTGLVTVSLRAFESSTFRGFMLQAREEGGQAVGKFILLDGKETQLLNCGGPASAVSHKNNVRKRLISVDWEPPVARLDSKITFRATFVESTQVFWVNVSLPFWTPSLTTISTSTAASTPSLTTISTSTAASTPSLTTISTSTAASTTAVPQTSRAPTTFSTTPIPPTTIPHHSNCSKKVIELMVIDSVLVVLKLELSNIITSTITNRPFSRRLDRMSKMLCHMVCEALEVSSLFLSQSCEYFKDNLFPVLCVVVAINVLVAVLTLLPIGPSHELKEIFDIIAKIFSVFHEAFILACICVCWLEFVDRQNLTEFWSLWVLIVYTIGILLFVVWVVVVCTTHRNSVRLKTGSSGNKREKKKMVITSITSISGAVVFAAFLITGIIKLPAE